MFDQDRIKTLTQKEIELYDYVMHNAVLVAYMSMRDIARANNTSTTTVLRFCRKLGYESFKAFKYHLKCETTKTGIDQTYNYPDILHTLETFTSSSYHAIFQQAVEIMNQQQIFIFLGVGDSGNVAQYAARRFASNRRFALAINDPHYKANYISERVAVIALSISGRTPELLHQVSDFKAFHYSLITITAEANCPLAKMSDVAITTYIHPVTIENRSMTSQLPAMAVIEILAALI